MNKGLLQHQRSAVVATYALCGFAHIASMAIFVGGISALVPDRKRTISGVGLRVLVGATLACFMTACVAGMIVVSQSKFDGTCANKCPSTGRTVQAVRGES